MCKNCDNFDMKTAAETMLRNSAPAAPLEPAWVDKLGGITIPATLVMMLAGVILIGMKATGSPVEINPEYAWVGQVYLAVLALANFFYWYSLLWFRVLRADLRVLRVTVRGLWINWGICSASARLASIENELELAREDYCGGAYDSGRAPELSQEIERLTQYRDALQSELDRLIVELHEAQPDKFN